MNHNRHLSSPVLLFSLGMLALFLIFVASIPVRVATPQIARLRYYACQDGISGGPLSSSLSAFDWRKAFVWRASDTEYRQRQFSQFFEVLTPRLYAHLYYRFGPFLWFPVNLLCALAIGGMIALVVRQWSGDWRAGLVAGSFWLMTIEVLVGHHAPIRYAKDFATLETLGILSLLIGLRSPSRFRPVLFPLAVILIWWAGCFTDEYIFFLLPSIAVALLAWPWLKRYRWSLLTALAVLSGFSLWLFFSVLPHVVTLDFPRPFPLAKIHEWPGLGALIARNARYFLLNTADIFTYTFGSAPPRTPLQMGLAALAGLGLIASAAATKAWKEWGRMILFWAIAAVCVGGILLPEGNDILHQHTYYNRPLVALLLVVFGLFTSRVLRSSVRWAVPVWLGALSLSALLNFHTVAVGVQYDPEESYLTRYGLEPILQLHSRLKSGEIEPPVYVSYPNFRDVQSGVYDELESAPPYTLENGFPWSLFRTLMPRLYLRHFETGELLADPRQFTRWEKTDEATYRAAAKTFYDMPSGTAWDLEALRKAVYFTPKDMRWTNPQGQSVEPVRRRDLLGEAPFAVLPKGRWETEVPAFPIVSSSSLLSMVFALRSDGPARFTVEGGEAQRETECAYRWSWQIFAVPVFNGALLRLETTGEAEVMGPVLVRSQALSVVPLSERKKAPPAGVPPLAIRGRREK